MSMSKFFLGAAAVLAMAGSAFATTYRSSLANGLWSDVNSWEYLVSPGTWADIKTAGVPVPSTGDTVTIRASFPIEVAANVTTAHVIIDSGATLTVDSGITLTVSVGGDALNGILNLQGGTYVLSGNNQIGTGNIFKVAGTGGTITLNSANGIQLASATSVLWAAANFTLNGAGSLGGSNNAASIRIGPASGAATVTLTNNTMIHGQLIIQKYDVNFGTANFANTSSGAAVGVVAADAPSGTILIDASLDAISDDNGDACTGGEHWGVNADGAILQFTQGAAGLSGKFYVGSNGSSPSVRGRLMVDASLTTSGNVEFATGRVVVANGFAFTFSGGYCGSSACSGTASPFNGPVTVSCP